MIKLVAVLLGFYLPRNKEAKTMIHCGNAHLCIKAIIGILRTKDFEVVMADMKHSTAGMVVHVRADGPRRQKV